MVDSVQRQVGPYRLLRHIGGQSGRVEVYEAEHPQRTERFALRLLAPGPRPSHQLEWFRREAARLCRLRHPNLVDVVDYGVTDQGQPFLVAALVGGEPLPAGQPLSLGDAVQLVRQIGSGLAAGHALDLLHGDLRPSKVQLVYCDGVPLVKVRDMGLGLAVAESAAPREPCYLAPEQLDVSAGLDATKRAEPDRRADVFSLGAITYELLSGQPPFPSVERGRHADPQTMVGDLPRAVVSVLRRALAADRGARYQSAGALVADLVAAAGEGQSLSPIVVGQAPSLEVPLPGASAGSARRWRLRGLVGVASGALVGIAVFALVWQRGAPLRQAESLAARDQWPAVAAVLEHIPPDRRGERWRRLLERTAGGLWAQVPPRADGDLDAVDRMEAAEKQWQRHRLLHGAAPGKARRARAGIEVVRLCYQALNVVRAPCERRRTPTGWKCEYGFELHLGRCEGLVQALIEGAPADGQLASAAAEEAARHAVASGHGTLRVFRFFDATVRRFPLQGCAAGRLPAMVEQVLRLPPHPKIVPVLDAARRVVATCWGRLSAHLLRQLRRAGSSAIDDNLRRNLCPMIVGSVPECRPVETRSVSTSGDEGRDQ